MPSINLAALQTLMRMQSPSNMTPTDDPFVDKRRAAILSGEDDLLAPSDDELIGAQSDPGVGVVGSPGGYTATLSRDSLRDTAMGTLRKKLGLQEIAHKQDLESKILPEQVKGQYQIRAAQESAKALGDRLAYSQNAQDQRSQQNQAAIMDRLNTSLGAQQARQDDAQQFKAGQVNPTAMAAIARERQALATQVQKQAPGTVMSFLGKKNPAQAQLDAFDNTLAYAQKMAQMPGVASAEDGLAQMGVTGATPDEIGQINKFLLLLRGH